MRFDLVIRGGEVVDPGGGHEGRLDVAVKRGRIAAVEREIPADAAFTTVDRDGADRHARGSSTCTPTSSTRSPTGASIPTRSPRVAA